MSLPNIISQINSKFPLSGGQLNGNIIFNTGVLSQTASANEIVLFASSDKTTPSTKSCLAMRNENHETEPGSFYIRSVYDGVSKVLKLKPDGTFTWNECEVITSAGGTITGGLTVNGGVTVNNTIKAAGLITGARLSANNTVNDNIDFVFRHISDGGAYLPGANATGGEWHAIPSLKGTWYSGLNGYRKWSDGLIEQWGVYNNTSTSGTVTFHIAFSTTNFTVVISQMSNSTSPDTGGWGYGVALNGAKTSTTFAYSVQEACKITWIAFGY